MNSDAKNSDVAQVLTLLKESQEFLFLRKKRHTHQEKKKNVHLFITFLFTPNQ